ncbi:hypothetical protein [Flavobacterium sp. CS20]|uniref:hypothetical protein n=1 Tax=Flavobacterium sp. CS20 TaxID=2775246 RepID=UPI001B39DB28|nr:hypothetical protein [Flavobacterium sp. CS20]QTY26876.1 hypothetical protein IGB25_13580 [Flavobacterium sp. CS20]
MKYIILLFFISNFTFCQTLKVYDKNTKISVPYAIVFLDTIGYYTDENGVLNINGNNFDSISVKHLNYKILKLDSKKDFDTIYLKPKVNVLNEILLVDFKNKKEKKLKSPSNYFSSLMRNNNEVITCLCPKKQKTIGSILTGFKFELSKNKHLNNRKALTTESVSFRLNFYENKNFIPAKYLYSKIYSDMSIVELIEDKYSMYLNFKDKPLEIKENGFCFGLEHLEFKNTPKTKTDFFMSIENSYNKSKYFKAKTVTNYSLSGKKLLTAKEIDSEGFKFHNLKDDPVLIPEMVIYK